MKMELNLASLTNNRVMAYNQDFAISKDLYEQLGILDLRNLHVEGTISLNSVSMLNIDLTVEGVMVLPDSVTTEPVEYSFTSKIAEEMDLNAENSQEYIKNAQNILDIMKILWENIVLEVPMRFTVTKDAHLSGDGWSLGRKENEDNNIDPRLAKLAELLDNGKE